MYFSIHFQLLPFYFAGGVEFGKVPPNETENGLQFKRNAPRLTGGTPVTRRRKVGGRSGSPHRGRRTRWGVSGAPNRRAVRPARAGGAGRATESVTGVGVS